MVGHLLLDADGVLQRVGGGGYRSLLAEHLGHRTDEFVATLTRLEEPALRGAGAFPEGLGDALAQHGVSVDAEEFYRGVWLDIEPLEESVALVRSVRDAGLHVHLVTNQHPRRAAHMKRALGYDDLFDQSFYSCDVGAAKPDPAYFDAVLDRLGARAGELVFVDDSRANVAAAEAAGLETVRWHHEDGLARLRRELTRLGVPVASP